MVSNKERQTGEYDIKIKDFDNGSAVMDYLGENFFNPIMVSGKTLGGAFAYGFHYSAKAISTGLKEGIDIDGLNLFKEGYKMPIDITHVTMYNNGQLVNVNLTGKGEKEFARIFTANFLKLPYIDLNLSNNKVRNFVYNELIKAYFTKKLE